MADDGQGQRKSVDDALEARVGQLLNEFLDRRARGEQISEAELLAQHPDLAADLRLHLGLLRDIEPTRHALVELLNRGILAPSADSRYPGRLGPYQVVGLLGRGGMGVVLKVYEERLNRTVALKLLRPELTSDKTVLARFEREAKAAAGLQHPNIVAVHAIGEENGTHFIVMEFVDGPTLATLIRNEGPLPAERVRVLFGQMLAGLKAAHEAGLVHRDIKSSNILLHGGEQLVKIADFGLARMLSTETRMTMSGSIFGTPAYMSPEQARGDENIDHRTDLYSAGVVLYEMLTGRVPFRTDASSAVIHAILNMEPPPPRVFCTSADKHLSRLALRLMAKRREDRFASTDDAIAAFEQRRGFRVRWSSKARRRVVVAIALAVCGVGFSLVVQSMRRDSVVSDVRPGLPDQGRLSPTIEARYGDEREWSRFYTFPDPHKGVVTTALVDLGPNRKPMVLAGVRSSVDDNALFAFDATGRKAESRIPLWIEKVEIPYIWPDCQAPTELVVSSITAFEYDGRPGQEVALVGQDRTEYPTYIAVFDPRTRTLLAKYWHVGQVQFIKVAPDFLGPGQPAIIAVGLNNKLDGFDQRVDGDPEPVAAFDMVPILMVLDAKSMNGERLINVPDTSRRVPKMEPVLPYSYAYLDVAVGTGDMRIDRESGERSPPSQDPHDREMMNFLRLRIVRCPEGAGDLFCIEIGIKRSDNEEEPGGAQFTFDPDLGCLTFVPVTSETTGRSKEFWLEKFHRLVVRGQYVGPPQ